jgi:hypothetical protein
MPVDQPASRTVNWLIRILALNLVTDSYAHVNHRSFMRKKQEICTEAVILLFVVHEGDYWRLLTPGQYTITAYRDGYQPLSHRINVYDRPHQEARRVDFRLQPLPQLVSS